MRSKRFSWVLVVLALPVLGGCYHYVPTPTLEHPQGTPLRTHLGSLGAFELAQITVNNIERVEGEFVRRDAGDVILSATWLEAVTGAGYQGNGWTVRIPEADITGVELKRLSWWRTGVLIGGLAVGTWLGFEALGVGPFGEGGGGPGGPQL
jgi:hypothetical protein